jgi:peptidylprolyl isomerase
MRDILISSAICLACLVVALVSQLVSPSTVVAAPAAATAPAAQPVRTAVATPLELDPDDPNPTLFTMAADAATAADAPLAQSGGASVLGGELIAPAERVTDSGLRITDLEVGEGAEAVSGRTVAVNYRGTLVNGREFDSSYGRGPFRFPLGAGRVIQGWDEGVAGMRVGGKRRLVIPPDLAYGSRGAGGVIPPDATLIFEVELLEVEE